MRSKKYKKGAALKLSGQGRKQSLQGLTRGATRPLTSAPRVGSGWKTGLGGTLIALGDWVVWEI